MWFPFLSPWYCYPLLFSFLARAPPQQSPILPLQLDQSIREVDKVVSNETLRMKPGGSEAFKFKKGCTSPGSVHAP